MTCPDQLAFFLPSSPFSDRHTVALRRDPSFSVIDLRCRFWPDGRGGRINQSSALSLSLCEPIGLGPRKSRSGPVFHIT